MTGTRTLVVWCPDWPLVAGGISPGTPAATLHANRVLACTAAARAEGVTNGMRRRAAQGRCPDLEIVAHDPSRDARVFEPVAAAVGAFTPRIEVSRPGSCALETRGPARYFGGDSLLVSKIRTAVDAVIGGLPGATVGDGTPHPEARCRVGVADGPFTAVHAAMRDVLVPPGGSAAFLAPLPVTLLDEPELTDLLVRLGLGTLGAFATLPTSDVVARFATLGVAAQRRARGHDDRPLSPQPTLPDLSKEIQMDPPVDQVDAVAFVAKALADELCATLGASGLIFPCVRIEAETEHGEHLCRIWRHHRAFTPATVAERVRWQLDGWLAARTRCGCPPPGPRAPGPHCAGGPACPNPVGGTTGGLTLLRLVPEEITPDDGRQGGFWGGTTEADGRAARGLARIQGLLGPDAVMTAVLGGGRGPSELVTLVRWGDPLAAARPGPPPVTPLPCAAEEAFPGSAAQTPKGSRTSVKRAVRPGARVRSSGRTPAATEVPTWPGRLPAPFPALVPPTPVPAEVVCQEGVCVGVTSRSLLTRPPARLSIGGAAWAQVTGWAGPWTADERWWDEDSHRRMARLQLVTAKGAAHLLVLEHGRWWVEATYD
ncbi:MAG: DNA polymerase Y family protein [Acidimicrobiales bacterium]